MLTDSKLLTSAAWDAQSLNELKTKAGKDPAANIRPVARQVEGMFVQMMLKSMRETLPKDGMFSSDSTRLYTSMYDQQIAQQMTAGKGLGLADMIVKQTAAAQGLPPEEAPPQVPLKFDLEKVTSYQNQALTQMVRKAMPKPAETRDEPLSGDSKDFLAQLSLPARLASEESGVPHHLILAQAALESGWGQRQIRRENGEPSFNIFGVKATSSWKGPTTEITTTEYGERCGSEGESQIPRLQLVSGSVVGLCRAAEPESALHRRDPGRHARAGRSGIAECWLRDRSKLCAQADQHDPAAEIHV